MKIRYRIRLYSAVQVCLLTFLTTAAPATSIFSLNTTGETIQPVEGRSRGMGGLGVALFDNNTGLANPGVLGWADRMSFSITYLPEYQEPRDESGDNRIGFSIFPHMGGVMPLPGGLVAGAELGLIRGFGFFSEAERSSPDVGGYISKLTKDGGAYRFSLGLGRSFRQSFSVGLMYDWLLGNAREHWSWDYADQALSDVSTRLQTEHSGTGLRLGTGVKLGRYDVGLYFKPGMTMTMKHRLYLQGEETLESSTNYVKLHSTQLRYPWLTGFGVTHRPDSSLTLGMEVIYSPTSNIEENGARSDLFSDHLRIGLGIEYRHSRRRISPLLSQIAWRTGYYQQSWETKVMGQTMGERFLTLGLGIPTALIEGSLDLSLEYGRRSADLPVGQNRLTRTSETIWRFSISLKGQERWRKRRRPWDEDEIDW
ncbi:hypothetical protein ACFLT7_04880 [candidate division KSB1 bacterium]